MRLADAIKDEIWNTVKQTKSKRLTVDSANKRLDCFLKMKNNDLLKGQKREIKKEVFDAKRLIKIF